MKIEIGFEEDDIKKVKNIVEEMSEHEIVKERVDKNINRNNIVLTHDLIWERHVSCLLTTKRGTKKGSPIYQFIHLEPFPLSLETCLKQLSLVKYAENILIESNMRYRCTKVAEAIEQNIRWLQKDGWEILDHWLSPFAQNKQSKKEERDCANRIGEKLREFGPKQSRNFLQWLGLTQFEIPIDSRLFNWLRDIGDGNALNLLSPKALGDINYYCCVLDAIQELCEKAKVLPCVFDAAVYASKENKQ